MRVQTSPMVDRIPMGSQSLRLRNLALQSKSQQNSVRGITTLKEANNTMGFKILSNQPMPEKGPRKFTRLEFLLQRPAHKPVRDKSLMLPIHERANSPMTMEDKAFINDRVLIFSLRKNVDDFGNPLSTNVTAKTAGSTMTNPPSFYDNDMVKWKGKFQKYIAERQTFKKRYYSTLEMSPFSKNTNIANPNMLYSNLLNKTADTKEGTFQKVMKRRKSRQSTYAPLNIDFDYAGNTSTFEHIMKNRCGIALTPNVSQLNYEMKLRNYKNDTGFVGQEPFMYPKLKQFSPRDQYQTQKSMLQTTLGGFKGKFNDQFIEKNVNNLKHLVNKNGIIQSAMWGCSLRDLKSKKRNKADANSNQKQKDQ